MFTAEEIRDRLRQRIPLRIVTSSGESFEVRNPDLVFVGRRDMMIGTSDDENALFYDRVVRVALMHVTALEDLSSPMSSPPRNNGPQSSS